MKRTALTAAAVAGGYAALLAALFWRVWLRDLMSGWDCAVEYWPDLVFALDAVGDGEWPGWNPYALGGYAYGADPQTGLYHPLSWLLWLGGGVAGDGPWIIQAKVLLTMLAGACGMHAWSVARTGSHAAAAVAAVTLVVGGPMLVVKNSAILWPLMWAPWALLALERLAAAPSATRAAALAAALSLVGCAGSPPGTFYALLVIAPYAAFRLALAADRRRVAAWGALAVAIALLLVLPTYLPASGAAETSQRAERGLGYVLQQPLRWAHLDELFAPGLDRSWMHDLYAGALGLAGGVWLAIAARGRRARAEVLVWLGIAALGLVLALGRDGGLLAPLAEHVPGFGLFRIAYRYKLVTALALAVLAGDATAALARGEARRAWLAVAAAWLAIAALVGAGAVAWLGAAVVVAAATAAAWRPRLVALVPALLAVELWRAGDDTLAILQRRPQPARDLARAAALEGTRDTWRYHVGNASSPYGGTVPYHVAFLAGRREWSGYPNPMQPARHAALEQRAKKQPAILRHMNVRYFAGHRARPPGAAPVAPGIVAADDVAPVARWYPRAEVLDERALLDALATRAPAELAAALVEPGDVRGVALPASEGAPRDGRVERYGRGELVIALDAPADGIVVVAEAYAPGWVAEVDGRAASVLRAHYHLRAVVVPAGARRLVLRYAPAGRVALPLLFVLGLAGLAGAVLYDRRRSR